MAEEIKRVISIDTKSSNKSINSLKKEVDELSASLNELEIGTKEYNDTLALLGKKQSELTTINDKIAQSSRTTAQRFESIAKISAGLASGYGAVTSAITLFGNESEDLTKVMVKLQSTIALVQGVGGLKDLLEELPVLGDWFKKLVGFINPFNTSLDTAAKNLNNIDIGKLKTLENITANGANININQTTNSNTTTTSSGFISPDNPEYSQNVDKSTSSTAAFAKEQDNLRGKLKTLNVAYSLENKQLSDLNLLRAKSLGTINGLKQAEEELEKQLKAGEISNTKYQLEIGRLTNARIKEEANLSRYNETIQASTDNLSRIKTNIDRTTTSIRSMGTATTALQKAGKGLKTILSTTGWIALATAIGVLIGKVISYVSSLKSAEKQAKEFRKAITETTNQIASKSIGVFKELQIAYEKVGDSADAKQEFLNKYADKIKETGLNINTVAQAEDAFINNTGNYVAALTARAKAQAIEEQAIKIYEEYLNKRSEIENKIEDTNFGEASAWQAFKATAMFWKDYQGQIYEYTKQNKENTYNELSDLNREIEERLRKMFEDVAELNKKYGGFFDIEVIKNNTTQAKEEINEFDVWLQNRLNAKDPVDELEDEYIRLLALAIKNNRSIEEVEAWHQEELKKIRDKAREDEENARKSAADKAWNDFQAELKRIRDLSSTSNLREPVEQTFQTTYTQGASKAFGLAGDYNGTGYKFTYQSRDDLNNQYKAQTEYNNELLRLTRERILQENELLNEQLSNEQLSADRRLEIERILDENKRALSDAEIKNEQANTQAYQHLQQARQQALQGTLSVASSVAGSMATIWGEESKVGKGFATAQALIDTYSAANSAYSAMAGIPIVGPALGAAAAAAAIAAGIANVKKIWEVDETSGASASGASASVSAPANLNTAPVEYTRNLLGDKETDQLNNPIKCYMLESEAREVMNKVQMVENNASF